MELPTPQELFNLRATEPTHEQASRVLVADSLARLQVIQHGRIESIESIELGYLSLLGLPVSGLVQIDREKVSIVPHEEIERQVWERFEAGEIDIQGVASFTGFSAIESIANNLSDFVPEGTDEQDSRFQDQRGQLVDALRADCLSEEAPKVITREMYEQCRQAIEEMGMSADEYWVDTERPLAELYTAVTALYGRNEKPLGEQPVLF